MSILTVLLDELCIRELNTLKGIIVNQQQLYQRMLQFQICYCQPTMFIIFLAHMVDGWKRNFLTFQKIRLVKKCIS